MVKYDNGNILRSKYNPNDTILYQGWSRDILCSLNYSGYIKINTESALSTMRIAEKEQKYKSGCLYSIIKNIHDNDPKIILIAVIRNILGNIIQGCDFNNHSAVEQCIENIDYLNEFIIELKSKINIFKGSKTQKTLIKDFNIILEETNDLKDTISRLLSSLIMHHHIGELKGLIFSILTNTIEVFAASTLKHLKETGDFDIEKFTLKDKLTKKYLNTIGKALLNIVRTPEIRYFIIDEPPSEDNVILPKNLFEDLGLNVDNIYEGILKNNILKAQYNQLYAHIINLGKHDDMLDNLRYYINSFSGYLGHIPIHEEIRIFFERVFVPDIKAIQNTLDNIKNSIINNRVIDNSNKRTDIVNKINLTNSKIENMDNNIAYIVGTARSHAHLNNIKQERMYYIAHALIKTFQERQLSVDLSNLQNMIDRATNIANDRINNTNQLSRVFGKKSLKTIYPYKYLDNLDIIRKRRIIAGSLIIIGITCIATLFSVLVASIIGGICLALAITDYFTRGNVTKSIVDLFSGNRITNKIFKKLEKWQFIESMKSFIYVKGFDDVRRTFNYAIKDNIKKLILRLSSNHIYIRLYNDFVNSLMQKSVVTNDQQIKFDSEEYKDHLFASIKDDQYDCDIYVTFQELYNLHKRITAMAGGYKKFIDFGEKKRNAYEDIIDESKMPILRSFSFLFLPYALNEIQDELNEKYKHNVLPTTQECKKWVERLEDKADIISKTKFKRG